MRPAALALGAALVLAGCPLPQAVPDYPPGNITPPRILVDAIKVDGIPSAEAAVHFVPAGCTTMIPSYTLSASVLDTNTNETIEARWFVNYDARWELNYHWIQDDPVPPDSNPAVLTRQLPSFMFSPYQFPPAPGAPAASGPPWSEPTIVRVVDLVVSNGFDPNAVTTPYPLPYRTPMAGFETQVYRWMFLSVAPSPNCQCGGATCVPP